MMKPRTEVLLLGYRGAHHPMPAESEASLGGGIDRLHGASVTPLEDVIAPRYSVSKFQGHRVRRVSLENIPDHDQPKREERSMREWCRRKKGEASAIPFISGDLVLKARGHSMTRSYLSAYLRVRDLR